MKAKLGILSEETLRRLCVRFNRVKKHYNLLSEIADKCYDGYFTKMLFELLRSDSGTFRRLSHDDEFNGELKNKMDFLNEVLNRFQRKFREEVIVLKQDTLNYGTCEPLDNFEMFKVAYCIDTYNIGVGEYDLIEVSHILLEFLSAFDSWIHDSTNSIKGDYSNRVYVLYCSLKYGELELVLV